MAKIDVFQVVPEKLGKTAFSAWVYPGFPAFATALFAHAAGGEMHECRDSGTFRAGAGAET